MSVQDEVVKAAERAVGMSRSRGGKVLDYTETSLATVEEILAEASSYADELEESALRKLAEDFGSYVLEVGRRKFGGAYLWSEGEDAPVLVTGEPVFHVAILTWGKVLGRLRGDESDNIPFFYEGYAERARRAKHGDRVTFV